MSEEIENKEAGDLVMGRGKPCGSESYTHSLLLSHPWCVREACRKWWESAESSASFIYPGVEVIHHEFLDTLLICVCLCTSIWWGNVAQMQGDEFCSKAWRPWLGPFLGVTFDLFWPQVTWYLWDFISLLQNRNAYVYLTKGLGVLNKMMDVYVPGRLTECIGSW